MGEMPVGTLTLPDSQHVVPEYWSAHGAAWQLQGAMTGRSRGCGTGTALFCALQRGAELFHRL